MIRAFGRFPILCSQDDLEIVGGSEFDRGLEQLVGGKPGTESAIETSVSQ